jgi:hypothetical protein
MDSGERRRRTAISEASDKFSRGEITRSAFLRVCAGAGVGLAGLGLSRPRRATAAPPTIQDIRATAGASSAIEPPSDQHKFLRDVGRTFSGQTVRVVTEDTPPSLATREIMKQEFMPLTGINVVWELLPLDRVLAKVSADTARRVGTNDVFYLDQAWVGRFVNDTVPVQTLLAKKDLLYPSYDFADFLPSLVRHIASYKGQVVGIPYDIPIRPAINDARAAAGLEFMQALAKYTPPEAITWDWTGAAKSFVEGRAGMYINAGEWFMRRQASVVKAARIWDSRCTAKGRIRPGFSCNGPRAPTSPPEPASSAVARARSVRATSTTRGSRPRPASEPARLATLPSRSMPSTTAWEPSRTRRRGRVSSTALRSSWAR